MWKYEPAFSGIERRYGQYIMESWRQHELKGLAAALWVPLLLLVALGYTLLLYFSISLVWSTLLLPCIRLYLFVLRYLHYMFSSCKFQFCFVHLWCTSIYCSTIIVPSWTEYGTYVICWCVVIAPPGCADCTARCTSPAIISRTGNGRVMGFKPFTCPTNVMDTLHMAFKPFQLRTNSYEQGDGNNYQQHRSRSVGI